jgi:autotransporter-associated beta strand protein
VGGTLAKLGAGTLTLAGDNTYSGATTLSAGTLQLGAGGSSGSIAGNVLNNAALVVNRSDAITLSGDISGSGSLTQAGSGTLTLSGNNTYSGGTILSAGTLALDSASALGSSGTIGFGGGTLQHSLNNAVDYSSRFSSAAGQAYLIDTNGASVTLASALTSSGGALTKLGSGTLTLSANNSYDAGTTVSAGTLKVGSGGATGTLGSGNVALSSGTTLQINRSNAFGLTNTVSGAGGLSQIGSGITTLDVAQTYTGTTTVSAGTLALSANDQLASGSSLVVSGGTFDLGGFSNTLGNVQLSSGAISNGTLTSNSAFDMRSGTVNASLYGSAAQNIVR